MATRADVLGALQQELRHAVDAGESKYIAQLQREIAKYSAGSPADPAKETTSTPAATRSVRSKKE